MEKHDKNWDKTFMAMTNLVAEHSTCVRRKVGALVVKDGRILSMGYNGSPSGMPHCEDLFMSTDLHLHSAWSMKHELHAEMNALAWAAKNGLAVGGATMYVTLSPCIECAKLMVAMGLTCVVYGGPDRTDKEDDGIEFITEYARQSGNSFKCVHLKE
jgi:dCMP deaminase